MLRKPSTIIAFTSFNTDIILLNPLCDCFFGTMVYVQGCVLCCCCWFGCCPIVQSSRQQKAKPNNKAIFLNCWTILESSVSAAPSAGIKKLSKNTIYSLTPQFLPKENYGGKVHVMCCKCIYYYYYCYYYIEYLVQLSVNRMLFIPNKSHFDEHATYMIVFQRACRILLLQLLHCILFKSPIISSSCTTSWMFFLGPKGTTTRCQAFSF